MPTRQRHWEYAEKSMVIALNLHEHDPHNAGEILWGALLEAPQCQSHLTLHGTFYKKDSMKPETHRRTFQRTQDLIRLLLQE